MIVTLRDMIYWALILIKDLILDVWRLAYVFRGISNHNSGQRG